MLVPKKKKNLRRTATGVLKESSHLIVGFISKEALVMSDSASGETLYSFSKWGNAVF